ncbi:hypothetical protein GCM10010151_08300 [Actinoallomurus spadix]|uniref:Uncharacterized protein n=1 Tax=Actinoallomurus spadix TaxID=79912 RepID=A0ABP3FLU8_9ACTN
MAQPVRLPADAVVTGDAQEDIATAAPANASAAKVRFSMGRLLLEDDRSIGHRNPPRDHRRERSRPGPGG